MIGAIHCAIYISLYSRLSTAEMRRLAAETPVTKDQYAEKDAEKYAEIF